MPASSPPCPSEPSPLVGRPRTKWHSQRWRLAGKALPIGYVHFLIVNLSLRSFPLPPLARSGLGTWQCRSAPFRPGLQEDEGLRGAALGVQQQGTTRSSCIFHLLPAVPRAPIHVSCQLCSSSTSPESHGVPLRAAQPPPLRHGVNSNVNNVAARSAGSRSHLCVLLPTLSSQASAAFPRAQSCIHGLACPAPTHPQPTHDAQRTGVC